MTRLFFLILDAADNIDTISKIKTTNSSRHQRLKGTNVSQLDREYAYSDNSAVDSDRLKFFTFNFKLVPLYPYRRNTLFS